MWKRHASWGGRHWIVHHQRNTRAQIWGGWILRSNVGSIHHVALRNSTPAVEFAEALTQKHPPPPLSPRLDFPNIFLLVTTEKHSCNKGNKTRRACPVRLRISFAEKPQ